MLRVWITYVLALAACGDSLPRTSLLGSGSASPQLEAACRLTEHKCTRCHTIGRALAYDAVTREQWTPLVHRMRQMASSGITRADVDVILTCLSSRR